jgi:acyl-coenzyme A thioesterase PaaI-like protein
MPYESDHQCFACGSANPIGLHLEFAYREGAAEARFTPAPAFQGYPGLMHGGLVCTLLDEAMAHAVIATSGTAVTGDLHVRLRGAGVPIGRPLRLVGRVTGQRGRLVLAEAVVYDEAGKVLAQGEGKFMRVSEEGGGLRSSC